LICRVINKRYGTADAIIGRFITFLLEHDRKAKKKRIKMISIFEV
jgi:hypothetical protein